MLGPLIPATPTQDSLLTLSIVERNFIIYRFWRNQVAVLAQWSGLIAARSLNLDTCYNIKTEGLILQTCAKKVVEISVKNGRCGSQAVVTDEHNNTYCVAKNGWS